MPTLSARRTALWQALFVTFLWATSWVLVKTGLRDLPPLTFAGLRYTLAWLCLLPFALRPAARASLRGLRPADWLRLAVLGLVFYSLTQGAQFVALRHLPAITVNLILNFSTLAVAGLGVAFLAERPAPRQWVGVLIALAGALVFFYRPQAAGSHPLGLATAFVALAANALSSVLGRRLNRASRLSPLTVTTVSMGLGALPLLGFGLAFQGLPSLTLTHWASVLWLAVVNTALAFTLWNHTLRTLTALESSLINGLLIVQIPLLAWVFLGERLTTLQIAGLILAGGGALLVQLSAPTDPSPVAKSDQPTPV